MKATTSIFPLLIFHLLIIELSWGQPFTRVESATGLDQSSHTMGISVADFDLDHNLDLFIVAKRPFDVNQKSTWSKLWRNNNDGTFTDITIQAGLGGLNKRDVEDPGWEFGVNMGASWGDYDNDGYPDLFLTNYQQIQLLHNDGDGSFSNVTAQAGLPQQDSCYNTSALWWDFNQDGFLDVFVSRWGFCEENRLFKNQGDGTFVLAATFTGKAEKTWMSLPIDANHDGLIDLYLANDFTANELLIQDKNHSFTDLSHTYGVDYNGNEMGMATGDYNNDGLFDLYITNISENRFMVQSSPGVFEELAESKNILNTFWGWGTQFGDYDLDGDQDLFVVNGYEKDQLFYPVLKTNFLYKNLFKEGETTFKDWSDSAQIKENANSMGLEVFDYDNDGDLDLLVSNMDASPFFYDNQAIDSRFTASRNWVKIKLEGTISNRDAIGAQISLTVNGEKQHRFYHGAGLFSQSLQPIHFGLDEDTQIDSLSIMWPSGLVETIYNLPVNQTISIKETHGYQVLDIQGEKVYGCTDPHSCSYDPEATFDDGSCTYLPAPTFTGNTSSKFMEIETYEVAENPDHTFVWEVENGHIISGQNTSSITIKWGVAKTGKVSVIESGSCWSVKSESMINLTIHPNPLNYSIARLWNEALLEAIRGDYARPTVHARNLFHTSIAMYDIWAVFDAKAKPYLLGQNVGEFQSEFTGFESQESTELSQEMAISYAVYHLLSYRFEESPGVQKSQEIFDLLMDELGYDPAFTSVDYSSGNPAALGNFMAQTIIEFGHQDGAREVSKYDNAWYQPVNPPLVTAQKGNPELIDPNRWQPLTLDLFIDQSGNIIEHSTPEFLSPEWGNLTPFSLKNSDQSSYARNGNTYQVYIDPGKPPLLDTLNHASENDPYQWGFSLVSIWGAHLDPNDGVMWDISPKSLGNISPELFPDQFEDFPQFYRQIEGGDLSKGRVMNPITQQPYDSQWVPRGDYARVLAEFWADGPDSETPPGHWFVLLNNVNDHPDFTRSLGGKGPILSPLEWEVKSYFILGGAMHDAAISAWSIKGWYDYIRPVSAIRYMADLGQSSDPDLPYYHPAGIPLKKGFIELVKPGDSLAGSNDQNLYKIKLYTWKGHQFIENPATDQAGVGWILAEEWMPYQRPSFVTPPFAGYVSGHSTYSRAAAEVMTMMTGDEYFPGGMAEFVAPKDQFLVFEQGPSQDIRLQWATYRDASDQCSLSRIWGGIHPPADDIPGRLIGEKIGTQAYQYALPYFDITLDPKRQEMRLFPNPVAAKGALTITHTLPDQVFTMTDLSGRIIQITQQEFNPSRTCTRINIQHVPAGTYLIHSNEKAWKVVVQP